MKTETEGKNKKVVNGKIKSSNKVKLASSILAFVAGATSFFATTGLIKSNANNVTLPSKSQIIQTINNLGAEIDYLQLPSNLSLENSSVSRFITNKNKSIKIFAKDSVFDFSKKAIKDCVLYLNLVFEIINPEYKFEFVTEKTFGDAFNDNFIVIEQEPIKDMGRASFSKIVSLTNYGKKIFYNHITLSPELNKYNSYEVVLHEIMHLFGFADAYEIEDYKTPTTMDASGNNMVFSFLSPNDFKLLLAYYSNNPQQNMQKYEQLLDFDKNFKNSLEKPFAQIIKNEILNLFKQNGIKEDENLEPTIATNKNYYSTCNSDAIYAYCNHKVLTCDYLYDYSLKSEKWGSYEILYINQYESFDDIVKSLIHDEKASSHNLILEYGNHAVLIPEFCLKILHFSSPEIKVLNKISKQEFENLYQKNSEKSASKSDVLTN